MVASHEIIPLVLGTKNVLRMEAKGIIAMLLRPLLSYAIGRALAQENLGLKRRCEEIAKEGTRPA